MPIVYLAFLHFSHIYKNEYWPVINDFWTCSILPHYIFWQYSFTGLYGVYLYILYFTIVYYTYFVYLHTSVAKHTIHIKYVILFLNFICSLLHLLRLFHILLHKHTRVKRLVSDAAADRLAIVLNQDSGKLKKKS